MTTKTVDAGVELTSNRAERIATEEIADESYTPQIRLACCGVISCGGGTELS